MFEEVTTRFNYLSARVWRINEFSKCSCEAHESFGPEGGAILINYVGVSIQSEQRK